MLKKINISYLCKNILLIAGVFFLPFKVLATITNNPAVPPAFTFAGAGDTLNTTIPLIINDSASNTVSTGAFANTITNVNSGGSIQHTGTGAGAAFAAVAGGTGWALNVNNGGFISVLGTSVDAIKATAATGIVTLTGDGYISGKISTVTSGTMTIRLNGSGSIFGDVDLSVVAGSTINFNNASNSSTITGNITGNGSTIEIGPVSAGNFTPSSGTTIAGITTLTVTNGSFTSNGDIADIDALSTSNVGTLNISHSLKPDVSLANAGILNLSGLGNVNAFIGTATFANTGTMNLSNLNTSFNTTSFANGSTNSAAGIINIDNSTFTTSGPKFTNSGAMYAYNSSSSNTTAISGELKGGGAASFNIGRDFSGTLYSDTIVTAGDITFTPTVKVWAGTFNISSPISGLTTTFTVNSGATANISAILTGTGTLVNHGDMVLNSGAAFTSFASGTNDGTLTVAANVSFGAIPLLFDNSGTFVVSSARTITNIALTNTGTVAMSITDATTFDKFICGAGCSANFTGGRLVVSSSFEGVVDNSVDWDILTATAAITGLTTNNIVLPNSLFDKWLIKTNTSSLLTISNIRIQPTNLTRLLASALDPLFDGRALNTQQAILANAINSVSNNSAQLNGALKKLIPNINAVTPNITTQNIIFAKMEDRIAAVRNERSSKHATGFTAGDINANTAVWIGGFGSRAKQWRRGVNEGYSAKTGGLLIGVDHRNYYKNIVGIAFGTSNTHVAEALNKNFNTKITGYHGLLYGTNLLKRNNFFEWLVTGAYNRHDGSRPILIGTSNLSTYAKYNSAQSGFKLNIGTNYSFEDLIVLTPSVSGQYSLIHQPAYNESGSAAALHVIPGKNLNSIVTVGAGLKISSNTEYWRWFGSRELRAVLSYDIVNSDQVTTANFIAGSSPFVLIDKQKKVSLKVGADFAYEFLDCLQLQLSYDYEMRYRYRDHIGMIKFKYFF